MKIILYLAEKGYIKFFVVGVSGVLLHLFITWFLTTFFFGVTKYFHAYLIGLVVALCFNFALHSVVTFKTNSHHKTRFIVFATHYIALIFVQSTIIKYITPRVGLEYYLIVIATTIFLLSNINFLFFKYILFKNRNQPDFYHESD